MASDSSCLRARIGSWVVGSHLWTFWGMLFPLGLEWLGMAAFSALVLHCTLRETGIFLLSKEKKKRGSEINFFFSKECSYRAMTQPIPTIKHPLPRVGENTTAKSFHAQCPWSQPWQGKARHWSWVLFAMSSFQCWQWCMLSELYPWEAVCEGPVIALVFM